MENIFTETFFAYLSQYILVQILLYLQYAYFSILQMDTMNNTNNPAE